MSKELNVFLISRMKKYTVKAVGAVLSMSLLLGTALAFNSFADSSSVNRAEVTNYSFTIDKEGVTRLEAEDVDVTNYVISSNNPTKIVERSDASGGKFLAAATGAVSDSQYFEFKFTLSMNAEIVMSAAYAQTEQRKSVAQDMTKSYTYTIDGSETVVLSSNYVLQPRTDITQWDTVTYDKFELSAGEHSVRVRVAQNTGNGNPNIDYIDFNVTEKADAGTVNKAEVTNYSFTIDKEGVTRLEAEDVDVTNYVISSNNPTKIVERSDTSSGKFLAAATGNISDSQYFEFKFNLAMNAKIVMSAAYAQTEQRKSIAQEMVKSYTYLIDENKTVGLSSNYVLQPREDITKWDTVTYDKFTLPAGEHTVRVMVAENTGNGNPNIDYIDFSVTKLEGELPKEEISPYNDIHTTLQYKYLNDENITNVYAYANGVSELSRPKAIVCDFSADKGIGESGNYINYTESDALTEGIGDIGSTHDIVPQTFSGFTVYGTGYIKDSGTTQLLDAETNPHFTITVQAQGTELYIFYTRNTQSYKVYYLKYGTDISNLPQLTDTSAGVLLPIESGTGTFGSAVAASAKPVGGMNCVSNLSQTIILRANDAQNYIIFYYAPLQYTVEYKVWQYGGGTLSQTIEVVNGTDPFIGSTATAKAGYRFDGWYTDEACTVPVGDTGTVTGGKLVPATLNLDAAPKVNTFLAKFVPVVGSMTIVRKNGTADEGNGDRVFVYRITAADDPAFELYVSIRGNGSVTIKDMVCREYTVEQQSDWSWRYNDTSQKVTISEGTTKIATFDDAPVNSKWLNGNSERITNRKG